MDLTLNKSLSKKSKVNVFWTVRYIAFCWFTLLPLVNQSE